MALREKSIDRDKKLSKCVGAIIVTVSLLIFFGQALSKFCPEVLREVLNAFNGTGKNYFLGGVLMGLLMMYNVPHEAEYQKQKLKQWASQYSAEGVEGKDRDKICDDYLDAVRTPIIMCIVPKISSLMKLFKGGKD